MTAKLKEEDERFHKLRHDMKNEIGVMMTSMFLLKEMVKKNGGRNGKAAYGMLGRSIKKLRMLVEDVREKNKDG